MASPPHSTVNGVVCRHWLYCSSFQVAGVACMKLIGWLSRYAFSNRPSATVSWRARWIQPPASNGRKSSKPAMSNDKVVTASSASVAVKPMRWRMSSRKFSKARCSTITPLGLPVEPEV